MPLVVVISRMLVYLPVQWLFKITNGNVDVSLKYQIMLSHLRDVLSLIMSTLDDLVFSCVSLINGSRNFIPPLPL